MMYTTRVTVLALFSFLARTSVGAGVPDTTDGFDDTDILITDLLNVQARFWNTPPYDILQSRSNNQPEQNTIILDSEKPVNEQYPSAVLFGRTCGGTIISPIWILTAAHCTLFTSGRDVLVGTNNTENGSGFRTRVKKLYIHPKFTVGPYWLDAEQYGIKQVGAHWDFLLAELEHPLPLNGLTLAAASLDDRAKIPAGENVGYAGFGAARHGETMRSDMHAMDLEILDDDECSSLVEFDRKDMICTKGRPPRFDSACNGDSGSGLISQNRIVGVASWVEDDAVTCRSGARVVFSRVAAVRDWIRDITQI